MDIFAQGRLQFENPFEIQEIVDVVATHCNFGTLQNLRLASRTCFNGSLKVWREEAVLVIVEKRSGIINGMLPAEVEMRMGDPSNDFLQLGSKPFSSYKLRRWQIPGGTCGASPQFWEHVSPHIKYLHVNDCRFTYDISEKIKRDSKGWIASLERILFPDARGGGVAPNMEHLVFTNNAFERPICRSLAGGLNVKLKSFHLMVRSTDDFLFHLFLDKLLAKMPNLENYNHDNDRTGSIVGSLAYLDLLQNLKCFQIWGPHVVHNFSFLSAARNLQVLKINLLCYEKRNDLDYQRFLRKRPMPPLRNLVEQLTSYRSMFGIQREGLVHLEIDFKFSPGNLWHMKNWMPNLVVLKTILNDDIFPVVCQDWSTLRELALLFGSDVSDKAVVGSSMRDPSTDRRRGFNITNLEDLQKFSIDAYCNQSRLGDASVLHGFLQMTRLTNLKICVSPQMSEKTIARLERKIQCVQIISNFGPRPHFGYDCCSRLDFYYDAVEGARPHVCEERPSFFKNWLLKTILCG